MSVSILPKSEYDVLNIVALKKMATSGVIAQVTGHSADDVGPVLSQLEERGLLAMAGGAALPTNEAEPALKASANDHYAALREDPALGELVDRFESVNSQFLITMSSWQQLDIGGQKVTNDHTDADYDEKVIGRLDKLTRRLEPLLQSMSGHDPRFGVYSQRFAAALEAIDAGQHSLVSSATEDSVHNIWFEFHEDLLRTLGRERTE